LAQLLLRDHAASESAVRGIWARINRGRDRGLARLQRAYAALLSQLLAHRRFLFAWVLLALVVVGAIATRVGIDFFPEVDAGLLRLHVRAPVGMRLEETEHILSRVEQHIRNVIPAAELDSVNDTIGLPPLFNIAFIQSDSIGPQDAELLISLRRPHQSIFRYRERLRESLPAAFPGVQFYFQPADIISQVLNFGTSAPIDVQIEGKSFEQTSKIARKLRDSIHLIPGAADARVAQVFTHPALRIQVDRDRAGRLGLSQRDVANTVLTSLSSSGLIAPTWWLDPETNVNYLVAVQAPHQLTDIDQIRRFPLTIRNGTATSRMTLNLGDVATLRLAQASAVIHHDNVQRVVDVQAGIEGRDLGSVTREVRGAIDRLGDLPSGVRVRLRGQSENLATTLQSLALGLAAAAFLAYLLMVVLFQSLIDPLIAFMAVPAALAGVILSLAITHTSLNVESFMGAIMAVGLAVSNSILVVSFINEVRADGISIEEAVIAAGRARLRPVLMTATAMILGMVPMALGIGEAGEQNAPLGRAVIGGLIGATAATLFFVPAVYTVLRREAPRKTQALTSSLEQGVSS
jgi:multidrug efflux pump subunit AcrB